MMINNNFLYLKCNFNQNFECEEITEKDQEIFVKIRLGNEEAFSTLFRDYYEKLYEFAGRFVKDHQIAENIVQDVFIKLWDKKHQLNITYSIKSYLYTAVRNESINYIKKSKRTTSLDENPETLTEIVSPVEKDVIDNELYDAVHRAIEKLPEKCRAIYLMKRYDDLSYDEIAEILGISINTIKTQIKRALKSLMKNLAYLNKAIILFVIG